MKVEEAEQQKNWKVGDMEESTREGSSGRMSKEVVECVHSVVGKKKSLFQIEDGQKKEISSS